MVEETVLLQSGFVDLQVNGYLGVDFSAPDLTEEQFVMACDALFLQGTAAFLPTVITSSLSIYEHNLPLIASVIHRSAYQGRLLGIHLEGPFISRLPGAVGAHNPDFVTEPDLGFLMKLVNMAQGTVKLLTVAAELQGIGELIKYADAGGITVSIGHSLFDTITLEKATSCGAQALTHLGNGLPNMLPRHPNPLWAGLACDALSAMFITDGHHLPIEVMRVAIRAKPISKFIVVSDAAPVAGLPPGKYTFSGNDAVLEPSGKFHNPEKGCLVGSSATMLECMNVVASLGELSLDEMLQVGIYNPLKLIGLTIEDINHSQNIGFNVQKHQFIML